MQNLMSKIVKERPADPIEFLIGKLQGIQRQRKKASLLHKIEIHVCDGGKLCSAYLVFVLSHFDLLVYSSCIRAT